MRLLAIDPSLSCSGWALFEHGYLHSCGVARTEIHDCIEKRINKTSRMLDSEGIFHAENVVIEWPEVYKGSKKGNPNALLYIAAVAGSVLSHITTGSNTEVTLVKPRQWKGQKKKEEHNEITLSRMDEDELRVLEFCMQDVPKRFHNNAIDAIGIGLWFLKRD